MDDLSDSELMSFKGSKVNQQVKILGLSPFAFVPLLLMGIIPFFFLKVTCVVLFIAVAILSRSGMRLGEFCRLIKVKYKRSSVVQSACPLDYKKN